MVLVDSSVWIEALRRDGRLDVKLALEGLLEEYEASWCGPVKLEVLGGARPQERAMIALGTRDWTEADGDEAHIIMQPHQRIGQRLDAAAARRPVIVDTRDDDDFRLVAIRHG